MIRSLSLFLALTLTGCAAMPDIRDQLTGNYNQKGDTGKLYKYKAEMRIILGTGPGSEYNGIGVVPLRNVNDIKIVSQVPLDRLQVTTCSRHQVFRDIDKGWFGGAGKEFVYRYIPTEKEKEVPCFIYFEAFSKQALTDWGMVVFEAKEELHARMDCNEKNLSFAGVSICQTKGGLDQMIYFDEDIEEMEENGNCGALMLTPRKIALRPVPPYLSQNHPTPGFCTATFYANGKFHRMVLLGYESVLIRGGK